MLTFSNRETQFNRFHTSFCDNRLRYFITDIAASLNSPATLLTGRLLGLLGGRRGLRGSLRGASAASSRDHSASNSADRRTVIEYICIHSTITSIVRLVASLSQTAGMPGERLQKTGKFGSAWTETFTLPGIRIVLRTKDFLVSVLYSVSISGPRYDRI